MLAGDIAAVSALLQALAAEFILHETPAPLAASFLESNSPAGIAANVDRGDIYHVADDGGTIAGFIGVREGRHVFHLFVGRRWQGQGLARRLWDTGREAAMDAGSCPPFTVNASNHALDAYRRLGFAPTATLQVKNGIPHTPMQWMPG